MVETAILSRKAPKIFKKKTIITTQKETLTIATNILKKFDVACNDKREKYIWINSNATVFAWGREEMVPAKAWKK